MYNEKRDFGWDLDKFCKDVDKTLEENGWSFDGIVWTRKKEGSGDE